MSNAIQQLVNRKHEHAIGQYMDEWGEAADDPQTALLSIAASLQQLVVELAQLRQTIINEANRK